MNGTQLQNFHFALAVRRNHDRSVAYFLVEQGAANRRTGRNFARREIGFFAGDQLVLDLFVLVVVVNLDSRAQPHLVVGNIIHVNQREIAHAFA